MADVSFRTRDDGAPGGFVTAIFFHSISPGLASGSSFIKCRAILFVLGNGNTTEC